MSKEFNRSEYTKAAKAAGVWYNGSVCAVVEDGKVIYRRPQVRKALYIHCDFEVPEKYADIEAAELDFGKPAETKTEKKSESKKSAPAQSDRIAALETRMDSIESKLEQILAKLG